MHTTQTLRDAVQAATAVLKRKHGEQIVSIRGDNSKMPDHNHLCLIRPFV